MQKMIESTMEAKGTHLNKRHRVFLWRTHEQNLKWFNPNINDKCPLCFKGTETSEQLFQMCNGNGTHANGA